MLNRGEIGGSLVTTRTMVVVKSIGFKWDKKKKEQNWQPYPVYLYSAIIRNDHTYRQTYALDALCHFYFLFRIISI